jgi:DNA-binding response OmpR family regulator
MKILIADDSKFIRQILVAAFKKEGFEVFEAQDGQVALKEALSNQPDAILIDYMMPEMNGLEVSRILKEHEETKNTPVFVLSAHREDHIFIDAMDAGVKGYITKPFDIKEVIEKIKSALEQ